MTRTALKTLIITSASLAMLTGLAVQPAFAADKAQMVKDAYKVQMVEDTDKARMMKDADKARMMKDAAMSEVSMTSAPSPFIRMNKTLKGSVQVVKEDGRTILRVSDDFRASKGPDLKVFLNPKRVENLSGTTATHGAVLVSRLKSNTGTHDYVIPASVNLSDFESVLIHCEQFSVLWGGANLT